jgi:ABC-type uncharacterized transport system substrate-binding protein
MRAPDGAAALSRAVAAKDVRLVVAIGSGALHAMQTQAPSTPVIAVLVLRGREADGAAGHVDLDIPLAAQLGVMRALWPRKLRVGVIRNPARSRLSADALEARARKEGYTALVVDCEGPAQLLRSVAALKGKVDFLLCFPDPDLFNAVTVKPLVLAALEDRLPIVGFSPAFVRAGAAAGIYPDYRDTGRQAADLSLRVLRGEDPGAGESPRKIQSAVNQRIARLLGVEFRAEATAAEIFK